MYLLLLFSSVLLLVHGARIKRQAGPEPTDDCMQPPENTEMVSCCEMPKNHIWGNIKETIHYCHWKVFNGQQSEDGTALHQKKHYGHGRRYFPRHLVHNGCFVECLAQREGFLEDGKISKQALLDRLKVTLEEEKDWQDTAVAAVEKCTSGELEIAANETCRSGSAETVKCIFRTMFLECPAWLEDNEYCTSLKEFYVRCPNGPPPAMHHRHKYHDHNHDHDQEETVPENKPGPETELEANIDENP